MSAESIKNSIIKYKWWAAGLAFLLFILISVTVLPLIMSHQFQKWVLANGGDKVSVENVDFNPFTAKLGLYNIVIERAGQQPFILPDLQLHARWRDLFDHRFVIQSIDVNGVRLTLDQSQLDESHVGGILLRNLISENAKTDQPDDTPWYFQVNDLKLNDFHLEYIQPKVTSKLEIQSFSLLALNTDPLAGPAMLSLSGKIDNAPVSISGNIDLFSATPGFNGKLTVDQFNAAPYLVLVSEDMRQNQLIASVDSQLNARQKQDAGFSLLYEGQLKIEKLNWHVQSLLASASLVNWRGVIDIDQNASQTMSIKTDGMLQTDNLGIEDQVRQMTLSNEKVVWQGKADTSLTNNNQLLINSNGQLLNTNLEVDFRNNFIKNANLNWQGKLDIALPDSGKLDIKADGKIQNETLQLENTQQQLQLTSEKLVWQGGAGIQQQDDTLAVESISDLKLSGLNLNDLSGVKPIVAANEVSAERINVKALDDIALNKVVFNRLSIGQSTQTDFLPQDLSGFLNYDELLVDKISYSPKGLNINSIVQKGVKHAVVRDTQGDWNFNTLIGLLKADSEADQAAKENEVEEKQQLPINIASIVITKGGELYYVDQSQSKPFKQKVVIDTFKLSGIDSQNVSEGSELIFKAKLDNATADFDGKVAVFAADPTFDIKGEIQALSLLPYSLFMEKALGYQVDSGALNATTTLKAKDGNLDSITELTLHQLDIKALTEKQLKAIDAKLNTGLETGLSMLKDKNDTIKIDLPVNGSFDDLKVDPSDIINQALGTALKKGAKTYFAAALFPFGTLLVIADAASDKAMQVKLDPVIFIAGSSKMDNKYHAYLEKVAKVLDEKPEIHIKVCGVSAASDSQFFQQEMKQAFVAKQAELARAAAQAQAKSTKDNKAAEKPVAKPAFVLDKNVLQEKIQTLALKRAAVVTDFLIKSQDVEPKRLVNCQPRIEVEDAQSKPRSDLLL